MPSSDHARRQLIDEFASFPSETLTKSIHRNGGKCIAALVEGQMSRTGVVVVLSLLRSGSK